MKKKTVLITGASRGIGKEIGCLMAKHGMNVVFNYFFSEREARELVKSLNKEGLKSTAIKADISKINEVKDMVNKTHEIFGKIDILVNNAGISQQKLFLDISEEDWDRMFEINVKGMYNCIKEVLPDMIKNKAGKIVNISSIWGISGASCEVHYSASKAAVIGLTKALAKELGPSNICVNCVAPGVIKTDMISNLTDEDLELLKTQTPLGIIGTPADIAKTVCFLASDSANFITGQIISPNGGFVI